MSAPVNQLSQNTNSSELSNLLESDKFGIVSVMSYANGDTINDGVTYATNAINNAIADLIAVAYQPAIGSIYFGTIPELYLPKGIYLVDTDLITIPNYIKISSCGAIIKTINTGKILTLSGYNVEINNIIFDGGANAIYVDTNDIDTSLITVNRCQFLNQTSWAIETSSDSLSTNLVIQNNCKFYKVQVLKTYCDKSILKDSWITTSDRVAATIENRNLLQMENILGVPFYAAGSRWIDNYGSVLIDGCRFGGESGGKCLIFNYASYDNTFPWKSTIVSIENCECTSQNDTSMITLFAIPNVLRYKNNFANNDNKNIIVDPSLDLDLVYNWSYIEFDIDDISIDVHYSDKIKLAGSDKNILSTKYNVQNLFTGAINPLSWISRVESNVTPATDTDAFGRACAKYTATSANASCSAQNQNSFTGLSAGIYTFSIWIESSNTVKIIPLTRGNLKEIQVVYANCNTRVNCTFYHNGVDGSSSQTYLGYAIEEIPNSTVIKVSSPMLVNGISQSNYVPYTTLTTKSKDERTIIYASTTPSDGTWIVGDVIYNSAPASGGTIGWVCTTSGTPGIWKAFGSIA